MQKADFLIMRVLSILLFKFTVCLQDSDLRSALLLEQAAHCFINMKNPMVRKYAFHMILAGHRFSKAGQVCILATYVITYMQYNGLFRPIHLYNLTSI